MPYLQLDLPGNHDATTKRALVEALGAAYAEIMETQRRIVAVAVRSLGDGGPLRYEDGELHEVAVLMCDVRRGRGAEQRERLAERAVARIAQLTGIPSRRVVVEFTQHDPDEMYRYNAMAPAWTQAEAEFETQTRS